MSNTSFESLSERERQILVLASKGLTDSAISVKLGISTATIGTYWTRIRTKIGPFSRTELVAKYLKGRSHATIDLLRAENERLVEQLNAIQSGKSNANENSVQSTDWMEQMFQVAPDAILLVNLEGTIVYCNGEAERVFGFSQGELKGQPIALLVPEQFHGIHREHRKGYLSNPSRKRMGDHYGTPARRKDGTVFSTATMLSTIEVEGTRLAVAFVRELEEDPAEMLEAVSVLNSD